MSDITIDEFNQNPTTLINNVTLTREPLYVTTGSSEVVILRADEYRGLMETLHLLRSPNGPRLLKSIAAANRRELEEHPLSE
jgi:antitoxin YefM